MTFSLLDDIFLQIIGAPLDEAPFEDDHNGAWHCYPPPITGHTLNPVESAASWFPIIPDDVYPINTSNPYCGSAHTPADHHPLDNGQWPTPSLSFTNFPNVSGASSNVDSPALTSEAPSTIGFIEDVWDAWDKSFPVRVPSPVPIVAQSDAQMAVCLSKNLPAIHDTGLTSLLIHGSMDELNSPVEVHFQGVRGDPQGQCMLLRDEELPQRPLGETQANGHNFHLRAREVETPGRFTSENVGKKTDGRLHLCPGQQPSERVRDNQGIPLPNNSRSWGTKRAWHDRPNEQQTSPQPTWDVIRFSNGPSMTAHSKWVSMLDRESDPRPDTSSEKVTAPLREAKTGRLSMDGSKLGREWQFKHYQPGLIKKPRQLPSSRKHVKKF